MQHKRETDAQVTRPEPLATTNGALFMLFLLMVAPSPETSARATRELRTSLRMRVATHVQRWLAEQGMQAIHTARLVDHAMEYVCARLLGFASRSPQDFAARIEYVVRQFLEGDGSDSPTPRRVPQQDEGELLAPAPKVERMAILRAVLARLSPAERYVIELKLQRRATWETVARALAVSVSTAQRRHALATERAQLIAVDILSEQLEMGSPESDADEGDTSADDGLAA